MYCCLKLYGENLCLSVDREKYLVSVEILREAGYFSLLNPKNLEEYQNSMNLIFELISYSKEKRNQNFNIISKKQDKKIVCSCRVSGKYQYIELVS